MKKLLFITYTYLPVIGGIEQNINKITSILNRNYKIDIITKRIDNLRNEKINNCNVLRQKFLSFLSFDYSKYDIIFFENFNIFPHAFSFLKIIIQKKLGKFRGKIIFVPHGGFTPDWKNFSILRKTIKKIYNKTIGKYFLTYVDKIIAVSDWEKKEINRLINKDITVIRNGIDLININSKKEDYFVFVGRIDPIKNIEEIIFTFQKLSYSTYFKDYKLKIIGDINANDYYNHLKKIIESNKIKNIEFLGKKIGKEELTIISKAKCLFCLSKMENDPVVLKEAFSVKTKVLINTNYGLKDFENEKNIFIKRDDFNAEDFAKFLKKPFINKFKTPLLTWGEVAARYEKLF